MAEVIMAERQRLVHHHEVEHPRKPSVSGEAHGARLQRSSTHATQRNVTPRYALRLIVRREWVIGGGGGRRAVLVDRWRGNVLLHRMVIVGGADLMVMVMVVMMVVRPEPTARRHDVARRGRRRGCRGRLPASVRQQPVVLLEDEVRGRVADQQAMVAGGGQLVPGQQPMVVARLYLGGEEGGGVAHRVMRPIVDRVVRAGVGAEIERHHPYHVRMVVAAVGEGGRRRRLDESTSSSVPYLMRMSAVVGRLEPPSARPVSPYFWWFWMKSAAPLPALLGALLLVAAATAAADPLDSFSFDSSDWTALTDRFSAITMLLSSSLDSCCMWCASFRFDSKLSSVSELIVLASWRRPALP
uniref:Uncharacterized protein n=1 Tax=Anopheles coluzzii TaxID=1518534 RepID=A0A8W7PJN9_ANOCL